MQIKILDQGLGWVIGEGHVDKVNRALNLVSC